MNLESRTHRQQPQMIGKWNILLPPNSPTVSMRSQSKSWQAFVETDEQALKIIGERKGLEYTKQFCKRTKSEDLQYLISVLTIKIQSSSLCGNWHKDKHTDEWNITQTPKTDHKYTELWILTQLSPQFHGERIIISTNGARTTWHPYGKNRTIEPCLTPYTKIDSKRITGLNVKSKTITMLEENFCDLGWQRFLR